ncbi:MAG: tRNA (N(6)-L-threonylcarbamoyladenosine(37)-C(2))-methylthiotransferase [Methanothrix sp.]|nr:tRNA (N(6)-L-threonylcarbamoyladenosine(37)-C(2))-methylthiotransferase [Methanothrix sp.]
MRFYIETFGCTANFGNSQEASEALQEMGHRTSALEEADAVIVNTCAVTERTERKVLRRLSQLDSERLVVAGCLPSALPSSLSGIRCRGRVGLLGRASAARIAEIFQAPTGEPASGIPQGDGLCRVVNIAEGCNGSCSYCIVPRARGGLASRRPEEVVEAVRRLVLSGAVEIQLAAQDTAAYGQDIGTALPDLLWPLSGIPGRFMVRVGMMNPGSASRILDGLLDAMRGPRVYSFLHIPVQSGSERILEEMCRGYRADEFIGICRSMREEIPDLYIATDVIVGFPGEEEEDFEDTLRLIEATMPDKVNVTRYSRRPQTRAAGHYDMPDRIKKERSRMVTRLWLEIAGRRNSRHIGSEVDVLVTEAGRRGTMKARSANYTEVVIGPCAPGTWQRVLIEGANPFYLTGTPLPRD